MANAFRDSSILSTISSANQDFLHFFYAAAAEGLDTFNPSLDNLVGIGTIHTTATLKYQTFNREYIDFVDETDRETRYTCVSFC